MANSVFWCVCGYCQITRRFPDSIMDGTSKSIFIFFLNYCLIPSPVTRSPTLQARSCSRL